MRNRLLGYLTLYIFYFSTVVTFRFCHRRKNMLVKKDVEKQTVFLNTTNGQMIGNCSSAYKTYVDPTSYEDFNKAGFSLKKEIQRDCLVTEDLIGEGRSKKKRNS